MRVVERAVCQYAERQATNLGRGAAAPRSARKLRSCEGHCASPRLILTAAEKMKDVTLVACMYPLYFCLVHRKRKA